MQIITLTTDFGDIDPYVGVMKGVICNIYPYAKLVDITHNIPPQNISQAGYIIESMYFYFPAKTIHLCVIDPEVGSKRRSILIETKNYFFIGPDNGIFTGIIEKEEIVKVIEITESKYWLQNILKEVDFSSTFHGRDIFSPVSAYLAKGISPDEFGRQIQKEELIKLQQNKFILKERICSGSVRYIDHFGNLITDISNSVVPDKIKGKVKRIEFKGMVQSYSENEKNENGRLLALRGSSGFLELFVNKGNAAKLTNVRIGDKVEVKF